MSLAPGERFDELYDLSYAESPAAAADKVIETIIDLIHIRDRLKAIGVFVGDEKLLQTVPIRPAAAIEEKLAAFRANQEIYGFVLTSPALYEALGRPAGEPWPYVAYESHEKKQRVGTGVTRLSRDFALVTRVYVDEGGVVSGVAARLLESEPFIDSQVLPYLTSEEAARFGAGL